MNKKLRKFISSPIISLRDILLKHFRLKNHTDIQKNFEQLISFKRNYDVNSMKYYDEYLWPYIRNHLWANINSLSLGNLNDYKLSPNRIQGVFFEDLSLADQFFLEKQPSFVPYKSFDSLQQCDFMFFVMQNSIEKFNSNNIIYHKFTDNYFKAAKVVCSAQKFEIIRTPNFSQDWHNYNESVNLLALTKVKFCLSENHVIFDSNFFEVMKKNIPVLKPLSKKNLLDIIEYELCVRNYYIKLLEVVKPKVICLNFYHRYAPLISAANELGILTVDLQHGVQGNWSPLYNRFEETKGIDYQALPDFFAVYTNNERENILANFPSLSKHKPVLMGLSWLYESEDIRSIQNVKPNFQVSDHYKLRVLLILQKQSTIPEYIIETINKTSNDCVWVIRHHPKGRKFNFSDFNQAKNIILDELIDNMPLTSLHEIVDLTISEGSSLSWELSLLGTHGLIVGKQGYDNFYSEINAGFFSWCKPTVQSLNSELMATIDNNKVLVPHNYHDNITADSFIHKLLILSQKHE